MAACSLIEPVNLCPDSLVALAARGIQTPSYSRHHPIGVVHLGLGAFHRAHQALVFDALLQRGDMRWGVLGVAMHNPLIADAIATQGGLYSVEVTDHTGSYWQVPAAIWQTCVAQRTSEQVTTALAAPHTRWVTLTVTEKGYNRKLAALLVQGLAKRREAGLGGLTIASCDNISGNGSKLAQLCLQAAEVHLGLAAWITRHCAFPNSMVDRIVPAPTIEREQAATKALGCTDRAALGTEAFWEWVIERHFVDASDVDALTAVGVTVVDDVDRFEAAKLRMLNGSHTAMACVGAVAGLPTISDCIAEPAVHRLIDTMMTKEVVPYLERQDGLQYRDALLKRFANPALRHSVHQIASDCSLKIPQRWPVSVEAAIQANHMPNGLAFAAAAWVRYLRSVDDDGQPYALNDPMAEPLQRLAKAHASDAQASVQALCTLPSIWGKSLITHTGWLDCVAYWLGHINQLGIMAALAIFHSNKTTS